MLNLEPELRTAASAAALDPVYTETLAKIERRELTPILPELRLAAYAGVLLILGGVGTFIARNIEDLGRVTIALMIGLPALALYAYVFTQKRKNGTLTGLQEYLALLASLLFTSEVGYLESQFHYFDGAWQNHLLLLAVVHAAVAYALGTRLVVTLSIAAIVGWFGIDQRFGPVFDSTTSFARQAFLCAGVLLVWRVVHTALHSYREFTAPLDHVIGNLSLLGGIALVTNSSLEVVGQIVVLTLCGAALYLARRTRRESFAFYAFLYELLAVSISIARHLSMVAPELAAFYCIMAVFVAIVGLFVIHAKWKLEEA